MCVFTLKWNKKTAVAIVVAVALLLSALILLVGHGMRTTEDPSLGIRLNSCEKRVAYLAALGWEADPATEKCQSIVIPKTFNAVYTRYNELQQSQGFDLSDYCGMDAELYSYAVSNHPSGQPVIAQLILFAGEVIGGDVHSVAMGGFMHGLKPATD